jgi:spermidine/putrescine transport system permease protein
MTKAGRQLLVLPATAWTALFFLAPLTVLFLYSLGHSTILALTFGHTLANYGTVLSTSTLRDLVWRSMWIGTVVGATTVALAYPLAYAITLGPLRRRGQLILLLVLLSLFAAYIVRIYAFRTLLGRNGVINLALERVGLITHPLDFLLYTPFAVIFTMVNLSLPLAIVPLYASLAGVDAELTAAAQTLGATAAQAFRTVTLPLSSRGIRVGFALCCITAAGDYATPQLVGGPSSQLAGNAIANYFGVDYDWATGGALAFALVIAIGACILLVFIAMRVAGLRERPS